MVHNPSLMGTYIQAILAFPPPATEGQQPNPLVQFIPFILIFVVFYLLVFAPMRKKQKRHAEMLGQIKAGDRVITNGGIHGTVVGVTDHIIQLRIADKVKIEISKSAISGMQQGDS